MEAPFAYGHCMYNECPGVIDTNTNGMPGITVTRTYYNYYGRSVYVKDRNGLSVECITQLERDDGYKFLVRDTYQVTHEGYASLRQFVESNREHMATKSQRFQAFILSAMSAIYRVHESNNKYSVCSFYVDGWVNVDEGLEKPLYVADLDLLIHTNPNWQNIPHPLSNDELILQQYGKLIESQDYVGVTYEIVDTQQSITKRFINLNGQILNPKVSRVSNKADGIYIYLHRRIDGVVSIEEKYYSFSTDPTTTGVFNTKEEAIAFGDIKTKRAVELLALESELTDKKAELEKFKHEVSKQEQVAKQERVKLETELAKIKAEHTKSQSERDQESKKREHELSIEINKKNSELAILKNDLEKEKLNRESDIDRRKNEYESMKAEYDRLKLSLERENVKLKAEVDNNNIKIKEEVEKETLRRQKEKNELDKQFSEYKAKVEKEKIEREKELSELKAMHDKLKSERDDQSHKVKTEVEIDQTKRKEKNSKKSDKRSSWIEGLKFGTALVGAAVTGFLLFSKIASMFPSKESSSAALETAIGNVRVGDVVSSLVSTGEKVLKKVGKAFSSLKFW